MGYSVLYVAFGIVALWLLGEVLLQYKARLRWRLLAFAGFLGVVGGVALREVAVIILGAAAFGAGQTFVTLSYKRGFSTGWALGGRPGSSRRRRSGAPLSARPAPETILAAPDPAPVAAGPGGADSDEGTRGEDLLAADPDVFQPVYQPVPMLDDSGEYPLYDDQSSYTPDPYTSGGYEGYGAQGYAGWGAEPQPAQPQWGGDGQAYGYEQYPAEQPAAAAYDTGGYPVYGGYDGYGTQSAPGVTGDWTPQPHPQHQEYPEQQPYRDPQTADPYDTGAAYGYDPQYQPYIPQQQHQSPYEQPPQQDQQGPPPEQQQPYAPEHAEYAEYAEYADPYDPYRY
jgi:hypothetical protein